MCLYLVVLYIREVELMLNVIRNDENIASYEEEDQIRLELHFLQGSEPYLRCANVQTRILKTK